MSRGLSGNQGRAIIGGSTIAELTKWSYDEDTGVEEYVPQSGVVGGIGYRKTVQGNTKIDCDIEGKVDSSVATSAALSLGSLITVVLYRNFGSSWVSFTGRVSKFHTEADIDGGTVQPFTATIMSDGAPTKINW